MHEKRELWHSQNFIRRSHLVRELLDASSINANDLVVEIGPGKGIITKELLERAGRVIAIEQDRELAEGLLPLKAQGNLEVVVGDFLTWALPQYRYKVFSNIPFNQTTDIVDKITSPPNPATDAYFIMQEEAAYRFAGQPHYRESLKSIMIGVEYEITIARKIDRFEFEPRPSVDVVFAHFHRLEHPPIPYDQLQEFRDFVVYGYIQWQPTVLDAFRKVFSYKQSKIIANSFAFVKLKPTELSLTQWVDLFHTYRTHVNEGKRKLVWGSERQLKQNQARLQKQHRTRN